jgi:Ca2+-binding EF-hand superfamily protein
MTTLRSVLLLAAALAFPQTSPADAQEGPAESSLRWFDSFDQNGDGVLTPEEVEATGSIQFVRIDKDASGTVTVDEYLAASPDPDETEIRKTRDRFQVMDRRGDGNGQASPLEFINFGKFIIQIADFNSDGRLSRQEFIEGITTPPQ